MCYCYRHYDHHHYHYHHYQHCHDCHYDDHYVYCEDHLAVRHLRALIVWLV